MKIRAKLGLTFILLQIFGVTAVSSYAILFIRNYLIRAGTENMRAEAVWMAESVRELPDDAAFREHVARLARASGYDVELFDADSTLFFVYAQAEPTDPDEPQVAAWADVPGSRNTVTRVRLSQPRERLLEPVKTIRWIVYSGMFISIGVILVVSYGFGRYLGDPILTLNQAALRIASGDVKHRVHLQRSDEFGELARSLNSMAARLRADVEELEAASDRQSRFFADITHEIRSPLHAIIGSLEMVALEDLDPEKKRVYLLRAKQQAERLGMLFNDLLLLQRSDADPAFIHPTEVVLASVLERVAIRFGDEVRLRDLTLRIPETEARVWGDAGKLEQVFDNLVSNALKFTPTGGVEIRVRETPDRVRIEVADTGPGIPDEHKPLLFDRFYRTDKARSRDMGGTGLGLAVVKRILQAHGADIEVGDNPGGGTVFGFTLERRT